MVCFFSYCHFLLFSFFSLSCVDSEWDVFLPALRLPWQPRRKKRDRRLCKRRCRPSHVFYKLQGPSLSQPAQSAIQPAICQETWAPANSPFQSGLSNRDLPLLRSSSDRLSAGAATEKVNVKHQISGGPCWLHTL